MEGAWKLKACIIVKPWSRMPWLVRSVFEHNTECLEGPEPDKSSCCRTATTVVNNKVKKHVLR